ncbi:hypothetical protein MASR2M41_27120 [Flammeovirgaceae bacterium]
MFSDLILPYFSPINFTIMAKAQDARKEGKKEATKTLKEKRAEKKAKKEAKKRGG